MGPPVRRFLSNYFDLLFLYSINLSGIDLQWFLWLEHKLTAQFVVVYRMRSPNVTEVGRGMAAHNDPTKPPMNTMTTSTWSFCFYLILHGRRRRFWRATHDCVAPYVDIILHRGQFWAKSAASGSVRWWCFTWYLIIVIITVTTTVKSNWKSYSTKWGWKWWMMCHVYKPLSSASCDLDLWPPDPTVDCFMCLPHGPLVPVCIKVSTLLKNMFTILVTDKLTDNPRT